MKVFDPTKLSGVVTACFVGVWIVLGAFGFFAFVVGKDVDFKRRWFPRLVILTGILFAFFSAALVTLEARSLSALWVLMMVIPMTALISYLNMRFTRFCDQCGAMVYDHNWFAPMKYCSKCGAELTPANPKRHSS